MSLIKFIFALIFLEIGVFSIPNTVIADDLLEMLGLEDDGSLSLEEQNNKLIQLEDEILGSLNRGPADEKPAENLNRNSDKSLDKSSKNKKELPPKPSLKTSPTPSHSKVTPRITKVSTHPDNVYMYNKNAELTAEIKALHAELRALREKNRDYNFNSYTTEDPSISDTLHTIRTVLKNPSAKTPAVVSVVKSPAVLRSAPSRESGRIFALSIGTVLPVKLQRGNWYMVESRGIKAWLPADVLTPVGCTAPLNLPSAQ
ncbi:MAG: hypothetical protein ACOX2O_01895 [Bdellovibrionota bacterium]|jgi:hypothetical protein